MNWSVPNTLDRNVNFVNYMFACYCSDGWSASKWCWCHSHILSPYFHCLVLSSCRRLKNTNLVYCSRECLIQISLKSVKELTRLIMQMERRAGPVFLFFYHIISYHIISYHIISYHIISYHIISYHIISYHNISFIFIPLILTGLQNLYGYGNSQICLRNLELKSR